MHELSIAMSMMDIVEENARAKGARKVIKVTVVVGKLSGVTGDALKFCFESLTEGTVAENAELSIEEPSATAYCATCDNDVEMERYDFFCPGCGDVLVPQGGRELYVKELEIE